MDMEDIYTHYIHARPSFLEGMARLMDFSGALSQYDMPYIEDIIANSDDFLANADNGLTGAEADAAALRQDWEAVGRDMQSAMGQFEQEEFDERTG